MLAEISDLQWQIMMFVKVWANTQKTPIPQKDLIVTMVHKGINCETTKKALHSLINKGFIRRAYSEKANRTYYVMIRNI